MIEELQKLQNMLNQVKDNLTNVVDSQISVHESLKKHYLKLLNYAKDYEDNKNIKKLERKILFSDKNMAEMKKQIDKINELIKKG